VRVLVVEDRDGTAFMLTEQLVAAGHEVIGPARTSDQAIRMADAHRPAFAFVDLDIEEQTIALDVTEYLTAALDVNVIICTGRPGLARQTQTGAVGLISKPYAPGEAVASLSIVEALVTGNRSLAAFPPSFELLISPQ